MQDYLEKNIIFYGIMTGEEAVSISACEGKTIISIIQPDHISESLAKIKPKQASKIAWIHIFTLQIILKSTFFEGIDTLMRLVLRDDRIRDPIDSVIARGEGNLSERKIKFDVNVQLGISLQDQNLARTITLCYILDKNNFMVKENHPFSVAYKVNYALTNSHQNSGIRALQRGQSLRINEDRPELGSDRRNFFSGRIENNSLTIRPPIDIVGFQPLLQRIDTLQREIETTRNSVQEIKNRL